MGRVFNTLRRGFATRGGKLTRDCADRDNSRVSRKENALSRTASLLLGCIMLVLPLARGQVVDDPELLAQLKLLFPSAASFSAKSGNPPHFKAYAAAASGAEPELLGLAYWTTELEPLERGFDGPIKMLVGMDTAGVLSGVIVTDHREPYGYFSVDVPEVMAQFERKNVRDPFKVGQDIDAITRATITMESASRAVRNSSRKIARAYLVPPSQAQSSQQRAQ
jgi:NosR/NirI family nitrous oxide reductase transcriptional regulator